jgi:rhamnulokinase
MGQYLAFDFGAESGRAMVGRLAGGRLTVEELHRFANTPVRSGGALYWDFEGLWGEVRRAVAMAVERGLSFDGVGVDTWGVDYGLIGADGVLLEAPRHYRDARNGAAMERLFERAPQEEVFGYTGIQFMQINTLYQWYAAKLAGDRSLAAARHLLNIPDLFNYRLTGVARSEVTIASTTQFFNPATMTWATELLERVGLDAKILCPLVQPGKLLGKMTEAPHWPVYTSAGHDTASAVAAVPASGERNWCYISSGTWSLMGMEMERPVIGPQSLGMGVTNEVGVDGKIRLLKNIAGLWLLQECRRTWMEEGTEYSYEQLTRMAAEARPRVAAIDPDAFLEPGDMPRKIAEHCSACGQEVPKTHGEFARCILESLAIRYREVLERLEKLAGQRIEVIHIVGGGSRNAVLNQMVADETGRVVIAGPSEATAVGNILVQAMGSGELGGLAELREVVRRSYEPVRFEPGRNTLRG